MSDCAICVREQAEATISLVPGEEQRRRYARHYGYLRLRTGPDGMAREAGLVAAQ